MSFGTLFDKIDTLGLVVVATALGIDKGGLSKVVAGKNRVSPQLHDKCRDLWGSAYDLAGTHDESRRRARRSKEQG